MTAEAAPPIPDEPFLHIEPAAGVGSARFKHIEGYEDSFMLREGVPLADEFPPDASYRMNPDFPTDLGLDDFAYNLDRQLVVSPAVREFLEARDVPDLEYLPVALINHKGRLAAEYALLNVLRHVDAIDKEQTTFQWSPLNPTAMLGVQHLTVDPARVPPEAALFRLAHLTTVIGIRRDLAEALVAEGFTGFRLGAFADVKR